MAQVTRRLRVGQFGRDHQPENEVVHDLLGSVAAAPDLQPFRGMGANERLLESQLNFAAVFGVSGHVHVHQLAPGDAVRGVGVPLQNRGRGFKEHPSAGVDVVNGLYLHQVRAVIEITS